MTGLKDDLDENAVKIGKFLREELDLDSVLEQRIALNYYWRSVQNSIKKQNQGKDLDLDGESYFG